jgi:ATP-dependent protease ClpP protease subunit
LIHQLSSGFWGKYEEIKDEVKTCEQLMKMIRQIYTEKTNIPPKKLKAMMKRDIYLSSQECVEYGIAACL